MKKIVLFTLITAASAFGLACNGDNTQNDGGSDTGAPDVGADVKPGNDGGDGGGNPQPPVLKTQIDRMGRPAINTALNHAFDSTAAAGTAKDAYNADTQIANWTQNYTAQFKANLAILDALDTKTAPGDGCGNQTGFGAKNLPDYTALAGIIADDQLYVDTSKATCSQYLAVELQATGIKANSDCGGRGISGAGGYDVINITYAAAAGPAFTPVVAVTDGPTVAVPSKTNGTTFPYLAAPQ